MIQKYYYFSISFVSFHSEPNVGLVNVPDSKLEKLREANQSENLIPASVCSKC